jgi:cytochrome P450
MRVLGRRGNEIQFYRDFIGHMRTLYQSYGSIVGIVQHDPRWVFVFGPEYNRLVLTNPDLFHTHLLALPAPPDSALRRVTAGLLSMNGVQHRQQRRLMTPAFHRQRIEGYRDAMVAITERTLDGWQAGQQHDIARDMQRLTMSIATRILFGLNDSEDPDHIGRMIKRWLMLFSSVGVNLFPLDLPGTPYRRLCTLSERIEATIFAMIQHKRAAADRQDDVLAMLIGARDDDGSQMTDTDLIGQANLLFVAGHETSSNALTWTLFLLAQHPSILADLLDELNSVLHGDAPTIEHLGRLPLLERVVTESLRLLPPVSYGERITTEPVEIGPYRIPKGAFVSFSQYITHHMPDLYREPQAFRPGRWSEINPSPYEYLPFGAGPHACIGSAFALLEIKIVLAMILQRYRLTIQPGARIDRQLRVTLSPKHGMPMVVAAQDRQFRRTEVRGDIHEMVDLRQP